MRQAILKVLFFNIFSLKVKSRNQRYVKDRLFLGRKSIRRKYRRLPKAKLKCHSRKSIFNSSNNYS